MRALLLLLALLPTTALAQESSALQYRLSDVVITGTPATLTLVARDDVHHVEITLVPAAGKARKFNVGTLGGGEHRELQFPVPKGESRWRTTLSWVEGTTKRNANVELVVQSLPTLDVQVAKTDIDLEKGRILARPTRPLASAEVTIRDQTGNVVVERQVDVGKAGPGEPVEILWDMPAGSEPRIADLKFFDPHGFWAAVRVVQWSVSIPHEEVEFETAKWDVRPEQAPKLDRAIAEIQKELTRFQRDLGKVGVTVEGALYVAGYTDTVGGPGDNQALSDKRARAIAEYFKAHGVAVPVWYCGFGEAVLAAPTADDTDEARNRRAAYVLASAAPTGGDFPNAHWKRLH